MTPTTLVPDRGHLVWVTFDPQLGHEQAGRRPALVLTSAAYNGTTGLLLACPVTSRPKGYRTEVPLPAGLPVTGVVLVDQVRSLDWRVRRPAYIADAPAAVVAAVQQRLLLVLTQ